jgi:predicted DNA binding CopG/RHH family protein
MKNKTGKFSNVEYTDEPMEFTIIKDFLPPPDKLVFKESNTRVTINLKASNVAYFKREAKKHGTQYQKLIRNVLDHYVTNAERADGGE